MKLKKIITISMILTGSLMTVLLLIGLVVPESTLSKISSGKDSTTPTSIISEEGEIIVETVDDTTGEKTVIVTNPDTGESVTTVINNNGEIITSTDEAGNTVAPVTANNPSPSPTPSSTPTTPNPTPTPPPPAGTPTPAPVVTLSASPSTITSGGSSTLGWSATNNPSSCTASGGWSGSKPSSGSQSVSPTSTVTYTLTCVNAGGSGNKSVAITVNAPAVACGQPGGSCSLSDIQSYNTSGNCRSAINASGAGTGAYALPQNFLTAHQPDKNIVSQLCGKVYGSNLRNAIGNHRNGSTLNIGGQNRTFDQAIANYYLGPYN